VVQLEDPRLTWFRRWCDEALRALGEHREEIDALNVYPVPDGDTGTNLYLTFEAAVAAVEEAGAQPLAPIMRAMGRGALLGARGNSGVIVSQLMRAAGAVLLAADMPADEPAAAALVAAAFRAAAEAGYAAVAEPVEGTILTVARAAAEGAEEYVQARSPATVVGVVCAAAAGAREALKHTPEQLELLARAGVVDAGGCGLCVMLDAAETALTGRRPATLGDSRERHGLPMPRMPSGVEDDLTPDGPSYEVMYLLDADDAAIPGLRAALAPLGDSLVVVGGEGLWNIHVHVDDVGAAIEAGIGAGHPHRVQVTHFAEQAAQGSGVRRAPTRARGVVTVAAGPGLEQLFAQAGGTVVSGGPGRRCSTGDLLVAIRRANAAEVIIMPNDPDSLAVAEVAAQRARDEGIRATLIPTRTQVQGLAAIAVHDSGRSFDDDVVHMTSAAGHTRHGGVTVAARDAYTMAGPCKAGDALGIIDGDFAVVGAELADVAVEVVERMLGGGGEMVTIVTGEDNRPELVESVTAHVRRMHPEVDTVVYDGGQPRYPLLIAVE
jgi:DAK2 domain fusion protein YloV